MNRTTSAITLVCLTALACGGSDDEPMDPNGGDPGAATAIAAVSGDGQRIAAGVQLPESFVVRVTDAEDDPVSGESVTWAVTGGGGSVSQSSTTTASDGTASVTLTTGAAGGTNTVTATVDGLTGSPVTFTANAVTPSAVAVTVGDNQMARVNQPLASPVEVRVTASDGGSVPGASVSWSVASGSGSLSSMATVTDEDGRTAVSWTLGPNVGANSVTASAGGIDATANANGTQPVTVTVNMQGIAFVAPGGGDDVTIMLGDTVRWVNLDAVNHTATSTAVPTGGDSFASGTFGNGGEFSFVANVRGVWTYFCEVHPAAMRDALITVQ
jgi:plastocyanin